MGCWGWTRCIIACMILGCLVIDSMGIWRLLVIKFWLIARSQSPWGCKSSSQLDSRETRASSESCNTNHHRVCIPCALPTVLFFHFTFSVLFLQTRVIADFTLAVVQDLSVPQTLRAPATFTQLLGFVVLFSWLVSGWVVASPFERDLWLLLVDGVVHVDWLPCPRLDHHRTTSDHGQPFWEVSTALVSGCTQLSEHLLLVFFGLYSYTEFSDFSGESSYRIPQLFNDSRLF